jgi:hypothetical protein
MTPYDTVLKISKGYFWVKRNLIAKKTLSLDYLFYRVARPTLKIYYKLFKYIHPETPWTSQASIVAFDKIVKPTMVGFEYGSGYSTTFFSSRLKHLTSVEHDKDWYTLVANKLKRKKIDNVSYHLIPMYKGNLDKKYTFYEDYNLTEEDFTIRKEYHDYFSFISTFPNNHFDFIIVDGRARVECCLNAIPKLKANGLFVLDNSDRERYKPVFKVLTKWKSITTTTGLFDTTIWFKP